MREHYAQTKDMCEPFDYTTWDGGEGHLKITPPSVEREVLSREKIKRYDTLEAYHEQKALEDKEMCEEYGEDWDKDTNEGATSYTRRKTTKTTTKPINFNDKITIPWHAMSSIMWHYISRVTLPANDNDRTNTTPAIAAQSTTNKMLDDYLKLLSSIGQTLDPPTTNFKVEKFPTRLSSDEEKKRALYSKGPHFKEKFARRIDSVEMEKRRSRLSTPPTTASTTWGPSTFSRGNTYDSQQREGIEEFFKMNKIATDPNFFGTTTQNPLSSIMWHYVNQVTLPANETSPVNTNIERSTQQDKFESTAFSQDTIHSSTTTKTLDTTEADKVDSGKYNNIDIPNIQNADKDISTKTDMSNTQIKTSRSMSYKELSSVVAHYADLLRIDKQKSLYFETTAPLVLTSTPVTGSSTITTTTRTTPIEENVFGMTEAPIQHVYNLLFDPFRHDAVTEGPSSPSQADDSYNQFLLSLGSSFQTDQYLNSTDHAPVNQLRYGNRPTTPKVYSKGDVYAMGHRTYYDRYHDPMWRSKYKQGEESTTAKKSKLLNIFDDPLGVYMKPDTEEEREKKAQKLANTSFYPYWRDLNKKYFASTVTVVPGQLTPRDENGTTTPFNYNILSSEETTKQQRTPEEHEERPTEPPPQYSDEHYIERRPTTTARVWRGYELDTPDPYPSAQELARRLREGDPLNPEELLDQRLVERENEEEGDEEGDMPSASYMNLTRSDQLCRDREPVLRFFDDSRQFSSEGFKTLEGWSNETYNQMEQIIDKQAEELKAKFKERRLNKTRAEEERQMTTKPDSDEVQGFKMGNINFKHLENDWQGKHEMKDFKNKLKNQFNAIYERSTEPSTLKVETTQPMLLITNKNGTVIRRLKKIKRRRLITIEGDAFLKLNFSIELPRVTVSDSYFPVFYL